MITSKHSAAKVKLEHCDDYEYKNTSCLICCLIFPNFTAWQIWDLNKCKYYIRDRNIGINSELAISWPVYSTSSGERTKSCVVSKPSINQSKWSLFLNNYEIKNICMKQKFWNILFYKYVNQSQFWSVHWFTCCRFTLQKIKPSFPSQRIQIVQNGNLVGLLGKWISPPNFKFQSTKFRPCFDKLVNV